MAEPITTLAATKTVAGVAFGIHAVGYGLGLCAGFYVFNKFVAPKIDKAVHNKLKSECMQELLSEMDQLAVGAVT